MKRRRSTTTSELYQPSRKDFLDGSRTHVQRIHLLRTDAKSTTRTHWNVLEGGNFWLNDLQLYGMALLDVVSKQFPPLCFVIMIGSQNSLTYLIEVISWTAAVEEIPRHFTPSSYMDLYERRVLGGM